MEVRTHYKSVCIDRSCFIYFMKNLIVLESIIVISFTRVTEKTGTSLTQTRRGNNRPEGFPSFGCRMN